MIDEEEFKAFEQEFAETKLIEAQFPDRTVDVQSEVLAELKHPTLGNLEGNLKLESISKFTFGELQMKEMNNMMRVTRSYYSCNSRHIFIIS